jgi:aspartate aminotransferase
MNLSRFVSQLKPSPTLALNAQVLELKAQGIPVLNFTVGEPDFPTPAPIVEAGISALRAGHTRYSTPGGSMGLRRAIQDKLERENGLSYTTDQIVCGIGAKEILFHIFMSALNPEDEVILLAPAWVSYSEQVAALGGQIRVVPFGKNPISVEAIEKVSSSKTKAIVICSPNNPAGYVLSKEDLLELGGYLRTKDWWIISDEIYEYLVFDGEHLSLGALMPELMDRYVHVNGLSKGFAMTGWRVGYGAGPLPLMKLVRSLESHSSTCLPPFIEEAAQFALTQGKDLMALQNQVQMKERRDLALEQLVQIPGLSWVRPQGAFYLFLDIREQLAQRKETDLAFCQRLLKDHRVALVPGSAFLAEGYVRMSYACPPEELRVGLFRLQEALL